jgi:type I restriction enzyme S subunit
MKNGWVEATLGEIGKVSMCKRIFKDETSTTGDIPFYKIGTFGKEPDAFIPSHIYNEYRAKYSFPKEGDVLISASGTIGRRVRYNGEAAYFQDSNIVWIDNDEKQVLNDYLYHFYGACEWNSTKGATISRLYNDNLRRIAIAFPESQQEQQRIVGILDEAFEGIATAKANAEQNLQNARALFESHLQSVLRSKKWKWKTLGELCDDVEYGSSAKSKAESGVPVLRMGNIQDGRLDWEKLVYTDDKAEIKKYLLKHNDVLFNRTNSPELVGKTAIYKGEMPAIFAGYLIRIHRKEDLLDAEYLTYFLNSQIAFDYGKTVVISSVNQANINGTKLKSYPIPAPSLAEQKAIVAKLNELSEETQRFATIYERKLAALDDLKKSLLHQAFSGEL